MLSCPLCEAQNERLIWRDAHCRAINTPEPAYPAFCRVVWHAHVAEMSDLPVAEREHLMGVVWAVEEALRELMKPDKINLAALGNRVPHLHLHVIPRFHDDAHFPDAVWAEPKRSGVERRVNTSALQIALAQRLGNSLAI